MPRLLAATLLLTLRIMALSARLAACRRTRMTPVIDKISPKTISVTLSGHKTHVRYKVYNVAAHVCV